MKKRTSIGLSIALVGMLVLAACASPAVETEVPVVEAPAVIEATEAEVAEPPMVEETQAEVTGEIESLILEKIMGSDHSLDFILSQDKTREEWSSTLDRMIGYGAKISAEEKETLIDWLVSR